MKMKPLIQGLKINLKNRLVGFIYRSEGRNQDLYFSQAQIRLETGITILGFF